MGEEKKNVKPEIPLDVQQSIKPAEPQESEPAAPQAAPKRKPAKKA